MCCSQQIYCNNYIDALNFIFDWTTWGRNDEDWTRIIHLCHLVHTKVKLNYCAPNLLRTEEILYVYIYNYLAFLLLLVFFSFSVMCIKRIVIWTYTFMIYSMVFISFSFLLFNVLMLDIFFKNDLFKLNKQIKVIWINRRNQQPQGFPTADGERDLIRYLIICRYYDAYIRNINSKIT